MPLLQTRWAGWPASSWRRPQVAQWDGSVLSAALHAVASSPKHGEKWALKGNLGCPCPPPRGAKRRPFPLSELPPPQPGHWNSAHLGRSSIVLPRTLRERGHRCATWGLGTAEAGGSTGVTQVFGKTSHTILCLPEHRPGPSSRGTHNLSLQAANTTHTLEAPRAPEGDPLGSGTVPWGPVGARPQRRCRAARPEDIASPFTLENEPADVTLRDEAGHSTGSLE